MLVKSVVGNYPIACHRQHDLRRSSRELLVRMLMYARHRCNAIRFSAFGFNTTLGVVLSVP